MTAYTKDLSAGLGFTGALSKQIGLDGSAEFLVELNGGTAGSGGGDTVTVVAGAADIPQMVSVSFSGQSAVSTPPVEIGQAAITATAQVLTTVASPAIVGGRPITPDVWVRPDSNLAITLGPGGIEVVPDPDPIIPTNPPNPGGVAATYTWTVTTLAAPSAAGYQLTAWPPVGGSGPVWKSSTAFAPRVKRHVAYGPNGQSHTYTRGVHFDAGDVEHMWMDWGSSLSQPFTVLVCGILHHYPYRTYGHYVLDSGKATSSGLADGNDHAIDDGLNYRSLMLYQSRTSILATHTGYDAARDGKHVTARNNFAPRPRVMFGVFNGASSYIGAYDVRNKYIKKGAVDTKTHRYFVMGRRTDYISDNLGAHMTVFEIRMFTSALTKAQILGHYKQLAATWKFNKYHV